MSSTPADRGSCLPGRSRCGRREGTTLSGGQHLEELPRNYPVLSAKSEATSESDDACSTSCRMRLSRSVIERLPPRPECRTPSGTDLHRSRRASFEALIPVIATLKRARMSSADQAFSAHRPGLPGGAGAWVRDGWRAAWHGTRAEVRQFWVRLRRSGPPVGGWVWAIRRWVRS
jgi:hypothetical protein